MKTVLTVIGEVLMGIAACIVVVAIGTGIVFGVIYGLGWIFEAVTPEPTTNEYALTEMDGGVYGVYVVTTSAKPAYNFEMITVNIGGRIYTIKGNVNIHYTDGVPKLVWVNESMINNDTADLYVPKGSIRYDGVVNID